MTSGSQELPTFCGIMNVHKNSLTSACTGPDEAILSPSILLVKIRFNVTRLINKTSVEHIVMLINHLKTQIDILHYKKVDIIHLSILRSRL
jgi:hypothetical protein